ncbi:arsenosugar biosynthesis radical SAM (seleno)protein ArsS [Halomonas binhaiensis]|uniref:Arsenosugar biosynthesis radical SAM protein ArsS n=1 Tax=Halomonas binhaiensis TaxID=2562282 RepID=A0A5C1NJJ2_9GAMM|nr:arsenosugar biosynthesis radical SAM (seleno)protein ArsS [Halomonas binhaiensis]QEM82285.1 arsenosugar biosynthesis radical SAM protein ArsS [Halomonas binhaiensis]
MLDTREYLIAGGFPPIRRRTLRTLQVNIGYLCNLSCTHCHVAASPRRTEMMDEETQALVLEFIDRHDIKTLDLTGGAPEMMPAFRPLVKAAYERGVHVIDRSNLTILVEPGHEDLVAFLAAHQVEVVASLPCYTEDNVDAQRGKGVFNASIEGLRRLNAAGYGSGEPGAPELHLVFNPGGPSLPPPQQQLEQAYKRELAEQFGIQFDGLFTITNMPIARFGSQLISKGGFNDYMALLKDSHCDANLEHVMCRDTLSVDYRGYTYDCDFNQMLDMPLGGKQGALHLRDLLEHDFSHQPIQVASHCYGCTAGQGSSCGGALA